jgi:hypothetical protein
MIFVLTESLMNGTVTMSVITTGVQAGDFEQAKAKIKDLPNVRSFATIKTDNSEVFQFVMYSAKPGDPFAFPCHGNMSNKPLTII